MFIALWSTTISGLPTIVPYIAPPNLARVNLYISII